MSASEGNLRGFVILSESFLICHIGLATAKLLIEKVSK